MSAVASSRNFFFLIMYMAKFIALKMSKIIIHVCLMKGHTCILMVPVLPSNFAKLLENT